MSEEDIKQAWEMGHPEEDEKFFLRVVSAYRKNKSVFMPEPFTYSDFATCVALAKLYTAIANLSVQKEENV